MKCPQCGHQTIDYAIGGVCALCGASALGTVSGDAGFPGKGTKPVGKGSADSPEIALKSYFRVLYDSFARPGVFFAGIGTRVLPQQAILYGLVMGSLGILLTLAAAALLPRSAASIFDENGLYRNATRYTPAILIMTPFILLVQYLIVAAYVQLMLKISGSKPKPFGRTFRTMCFAGGAQIFTCIPAIGPVLSFIAWMYLAIAGLHAVHGISRARAAGALLLPLVLIFIMLVVLVIIIAAAIAMAGGSQPDIMKFFHQ